jgi:hypothetical protein
MSSEDLVSKINNQFIKVFNINIKQLHGVKCDISLKNDENLKDNLDKQINLLNINLNGANVNN